MKYKILVSILLVFTLTLTACGAAATPTEQPTIPPLPDTPTVASADTPMPADTDTPSAAMPSDTPSGSMPAGSETPMVPVTGGNASLSVSQKTSMSSPFLVDANGMTVYVFTKDTQNGTTSACTGACATMWPAVTMSGSSAMNTPAANTPMAETPVAGTPGAGGAFDPSKLGSITLTDGTVQLTYNGWPLYHYSKDMAASDTNGQGVGSVWFMVSPAGDAIKQ